MMDSIKPCSASVVMDSCAAWLNGVVFAKNGDVLADLNHCQNYLIWRNGAAIGWFCLSDTGFFNIPALDIAVSPEWHGRWMSRSLIREIGDKLFESGRTMVILHCYKPSVIKLALQMGAKPVYDANTNSGIFLLEKESFFKGRA